MTSILDLRGSLPPVRSQGQRGTCVAFALTCAHERQRYSGPGESLSVEALHWAAKQLDTRDGDGTSFAHGTNAIELFGQPEEAVWPYVLDGEPGSPPAGCFDSALTAQCNQIMASATPVDTLRVALSNSFVVCAGIPVWLEFLTAGPNGEAIPFTPDAALAADSHAVAFVGHDIQSNTVLVRNSWGDSWGDQGYAWVDDALVASRTALWTVAVANPPE